MTWTYTLSALATSPLMQVRYLIGDTVATDPQVQDEEIAFVLTQRPQPIGAAADVCRALAGRLSREADVSDREIRTAYSARARAYLRLAAVLDTQASANAGGLPYAGGISVADKQKQELNTDRVPPQFNIGMQDNLVPAGPAGNETQNDAGESGLKQ